MGCFEVVMMALLPDTIDKILQWYCRCCRSWFMIFPRFFWPWRARRNHYSQTTSQDTSSPADERCWKWPTPDCDSRQWMHGLAYVKYFCLCRLETLPNCRKLPLVFTAAWHFFAVQYPHVCNHRVPLPERVEDIDTRSGPLQKRWVVAFIADYNCMLKSFSR